MEHHLSGCNKIATFRKPGLLKEEKKYYTETKVEAQVKRLRERMLH